MVLRCCGAAVLLLRLEVRGRRGEAGGWRQDGAAVLRCCSAAVEVGGERAKGKGERVDGSGQYFLPHSSSRFRSWTTFSFQN
jgi:hypothetical protein